jgi:hypothetical protein
MTAQSIQSRDQGCYHGQAKMKEKKDLGPGSPYTPCGSRRETQRLANFSQELRVPEDQCWGAVLRRDYEERGDLGTANIEWSGPGNDTPKGTRQRFGSNAHVI